MNHSGCTRRWFTLALLLFFGCSGVDSDSEAAQRRMVFICTETQEVIAADPQQTPAVNPKTGRRTLVPGLYCSQCDKWYPAPPLETVQRNPGSALCPKTGAPLTIEGPLPEGTSIEQR